MAKSSRLTQKQFDNLVAKNPNTIRSAHGHHEEEKKEEVLKLRLPLPPNRGNATGSGMKNYRLKLEWIEDCADDLGIFIRKYKLKKPLGAVEWELHCQVEKYNDYDNLVNRIKWALDLLTENGILADDAWFQARQKRGSEPTQELQPKRSLPRYMYITLYPREPWIETSEKPPFDWPLS